MRPTSARSSRARTPGRTTVGSRLGSAAALLATLATPGLVEAALSGAEGAPLTLAYLDPGTGSFVIQAVIAALAGVAVTLRLYWRRIKRFFGGGSPEAEPAPDDE